MRTRHLAGGTALSVLLATASLLGVTATPAAADSDTVLPVSSYSDMVVDGLHQRVFVSSGDGNKIVVTDYNGTVVSQIASEPGAAGLVLSPDSTTLFVAVPDADAISAIDTATLQETARYPIGAGNAPRYLAMNGDTIWFGYGGATGGDIGSLDLDPETPAEDGTVTTNGAVVTLGQAEQNRWYSAPMVASSPGNPDVLAVGAPSQSPAELEVYDVSSGHAESKAYRFDANGGENLQDITVTPDGEQILVASGYPYFQQVYRASDLSDDGRYTTDAYPNSVAVAADGTVAAGIFGWYDPDVYIFRPHVDQQIRSYEFPNTGHTSGADTLAPSGLAWAPDGSRLFAVSVNDADVFTLRVLDGPTRSATTLTVNAPSTALPSREITVTGTLSSALPFPAGTTVSVSRTDAAHPNGTPAGTATVAANGAFSFKNTPTSQGTNTYTVSYAGDAEHAPATGKDTVRVARATTTLSVNAPSTAKRATKITVTGKLTSSASFPSGTKVTVTRTDLTDPKGKSLGTKTVASNGTFSFTDTPYTGGTVSYSAHYDGDTTHTPALGKDSVAVSRTATSVSVKTNHSTYSYGSTATVTGHLGKTGKSRVVSIYAKAADGTKKLIKSGKVNSSGDLKVTYKVTRNTTFWASFGGDAISAPKSVSRSVGTQVKLSTSVSHHYKTGKIGSTNYYWFHKNTAPLFSTTMTYHAGRAERFELQVYYQGKWYTTDSEYFRLGTAGKAQVQLPAPGESGIRARVRVSYIKGGSGDSLNTTTYGDWKYLNFTK